MLPVELIRISLNETAGPKKSALKLWTDHVVHTEPSSFETDDDGDTFARGASHGCWLEISRIDDDVVLAVLTSEENRELQAFQTFKDHADAFSLIRGLAQSLGNDAGAKQVELVVQYSLEVADAAAALAGFRDILPTVPVDQNATEIEYRTIVWGFAECDNSIRFSHQAGWRTGRRLVFSTADGGDRRLAYALGSTQGIRTEGGSDQVPAVIIEKLLTEMFARLERASREGIDGL